MSEFLISGNRSGLGKSLHERFGGYGLNRENYSDVFQNLKSNPEVIIHAAFNSSVPTYDTLQKYYEDNVELTKKLASVNHSKFIYISTVDVYPKSIDKKHIEDEDLDIRAPREIYPITKLMSESIVSQLPNFLILRCSALLGRNSRPNSLIRILDNKDVKLSLCGSSNFNYVLHEDVGDFIKTAVSQNIQGIFNVVSSENINLSEVSRLVGNNVNFGSYEYNCTNVDNSKIVKIAPQFDKTSLQVVKEFINRRSL